MKPIRPILRLNLFYSEYLKRRDLTRDHILAAGYDPRELLFSAMWHNFVDHVKFAARYAWQGIRATPWHSDYGVFECFEPVPSLWPPRK